MSDIINTYGDRSKPTGSNRGIDISSQRSDDLDNACLAFIEELQKQRKNITALDLGAGFGAHAVHMAKAGAVVQAIDIDCSNIFNTINQAIKFDDLDENLITVKHLDFNDICDDDLPNNYDILYSQRSLHYIPYDKLKSLLQDAFNKMAHDGRAFLSVAGYDTEYGVTYPHRKNPVHARFSKVTADMQKKHAIHHPIVTYSEQEFKDLLESAGFDVLQISASTFGNIKAIAQKPNP